MSSEFRENKSRSQVRKEMGGGSQFCASSSSSRRRKGPPRCGCGVEAPVVTSWTGDNHGRLFYGCGLFKLYGKRLCKHFIWYDEYHGEVEEVDADDYPRERKIIGCLLKKIEVMRKKEKVLEICLSICCGLIIFLCIAYVMK